MLEVIARNRRIDSEQIKSMNIIVEHDSLEELVRQANDLGHTTGEIFQVDNAGSTGCITLKDANGVFSGAITAYIKSDGKVAYRLHVRDFEAEKRIDSANNAKRSLSEIFLSNGYVAATRAGSGETFYEINIPPRDVIDAAPRSLWEKIFGAPDRLKRVDDGRYIATLWFDNNSRGANLYKKWVLEGPETPDVTKLRGLIEEAVKSIGIHFSYIPTK